jgi:hypothetical protein
MESEVQEIVEELDAEELLELSAVDNDFYCQYWFPRTFRQKGAPFHPQIWEALETPGVRHIGCEVFRGGAKTTLLRAFTSKRIALAQSRTILYVSETQDHAKRSVRWIKRQILYNKAWSEFFQLSIGTKKTDEWLEIEHGIDDTPITIVAVGITGQSRGLNIDDYRPDLIVIDDPCNEENTATPEQRKKTENLIFGALDKSLTPPTEAQDAKMVLLQTSLQQDDVINQCHSDDYWKTFKFSCFDIHERSTWEERFPTEFLQREKDAARAKNRLPLWYREMECKIVAPEMADFRPEWLKGIPGGVLPEGGVHFLYIDPVPPPSEREMAMGMKEKDFEVHTVVKFLKGDYFICEQRIKKGHTPEWSVMTFWELVDAWDVKLWECEPINYQRTLKWLIEKSMESRGRYIQVYKPPNNKMDMRKKRYRILDSLTGVASQGHLFVDFNRQKEFCDQFVSYPNVSHDDALESGAGAVKLAIENGPLMDAEFDEVEDDHTLGRHKQPRLGHCP